MVLQEEGVRFIRLDRKGRCSFYAKPTEQQKTNHVFLQKNIQRLVTDSEESEKLPKFYERAFGAPSVVFALKYLGRVKGFLVLSSITRKEQQIAPYLSLFHRFIEAEVDLAYRTFELQNFYETVHPRALALSTIHSVHRVMASSTGLAELLPRIGRLCAQVLKARRCDLFLLDKDRDYLSLEFALGERRGKKKRIKIGHGIEGHVADTAEFHLSRTCVCVPFIEEDVVGVVALRDKIDGTPFTNTDLEILKTLSEQSVVAIKNAQLFEETERLTIGSIKTINELLELSFSGDHIHLPLFGEIAYRMGRDLGLSKAELTNLHRATYLIDAGHVGTPERILHKKDRLTAQEFEQVMQHPSRGAEILGQISSLRPLIPIILHHHERYDGKGYPSKLKGEEIPIGGRIVFVVDSFMAMLSRRPYRRVRTVKDAVAEIKANSGTQFDPRVVESFLKAIEEPDISQKLKQIEAASKAGA